MKMNAPQPALAAPRRPELARPPAGIRIGLLIAAVVFAVACMGGQLVIVARYSGGAEAVASAPAGQQVAAAPERAQAESVVVPRP